MQPCADAAFLTDNRPFQGKEGRGAARSAAPLGRGRTAARRLGNRMSRLFVVSAIVLTGLCQLARTPPAHAGVASRYAGAQSAGAQVSVGQAIVAPDNNAPPIDFQTYSPSLTAVRIAVDEAPVIDGKLDEDAWRKAARTEDFYQVLPEDGAAPTQRTEAFLMYDAKNLYVGIYAYDSEPDKIQRNLMERDPPLRDDDAVRVLLDPFGTFRDSFFFGINPNGARSDALTENGNNFRGEWDTIWRAKARVVDDGWVAEFQIPFQSISFDPELDAWGLQIIRTIRRNNEEIRWSNIDRARGRIDLTNRGRLLGVDNVDPGFGLEGQLFVTGAVSRDHELQDTDLTLDPSANFFYKITPSLTGSLTFNTDFADAPLDSRQVNTGRFSLFFPETRDFFLQDSASFEFGGRVFRRSNNGLPFFTRNIGIVDGAPVDIIAGAKLSGKQGPVNIGAISTRTAATDDFSGQTLSAVRIATNVLAESKIGLIATHGDPDRETTNTVAGADFQYRNSTRFGAGQFNADFAFLRSFTDGEAGSFFALDAGYRGDVWGWNARAEQLDEAYAPQLGFVNRTGIRRYRTNGRRRWRPSQGVIRRYDFGLFNNLVTDLDDEQLDRFSGAFFNLESNDGDFFEVEYRNAFLDIRDSFDIAGELPVPAGEYRFNEVEVSFGTSEARKIAVDVGAEWSTIFDGRVLELEAGIAFRPNRFFRLEAEYEYSDFDLPTGRLGVHVASIENTIAITPDMTIKSEIQYDNISETLTYFGRFTWEPIPTREIFVSLGHSALIERQDFPFSYRGQATGFSVRLGHKFRL